MLQHVKRQGRKAAAAAENTAGACVQDVNSLSAQKTCMYTELAWAAG